MIPIAIQVSKSKVMFVSRVIVLVEKMISVDIHASRSTVKVIFVYHTLHN